MQDLATMVSNTGFEHLETEEMQPSQFSLLFQELALSGHTKAKANVKTKRIRRRS